MLSTCTTIDNLIPTLHVVMSNVHMLLNSQNLPNKNSSKPSTYVLLASCAKQNLALYPSQLRYWIPIFKTNFHAWRRKTS